MKWHKVSERYNENIQQTIETWTDGIVEMDLVACPVFSDGASHFSLPKPTKQPTGFLYSFLQRLKR